MGDIPSGLYGRLQETMLKCGPFDSDDKVKAFFLDERLSPWRNQLPTAHDPTSRVQLLIGYLGERYDDSGKNLLTLLLRILSERTSPRDACHQELAKLADLLEQELVTAEEATHTPATPGNQITDTEVAEPDFEKEIRQALLDLGEDIAEDTPSDVVLRLWRKHIPELTKRPKPPGPDLMPEFENREIELRKLQRNDILHFVITAPAGYGKTYLLKKAELEFSNIGWTCVYVDIKELWERYSPLKANHLLAEFYFILAEKFAGKFGASEILKTCENVVQQDNLIRAEDCFARLVTEYSRYEQGNLGIVLLIDSVEYLSEPAAKWLLREFVPDLRSRKQAGIIFKTLFAGRIFKRSEDELNKLLIELWDQIPFRHVWIELEPFAHEVIQSMVVTWASRQGPQISLRDDTLNLIAANVNKISGGHPKCIKDILIQIAQDTNLGVDQRYFDRRNEVFFSDHVVPVIEEIRKLVSPEYLTAFLRSISVLLYFNRDIIDAFLRSGIDFELPESITADKLLQELASTRLVKPCENLLGFYEDAIVRKLFVAEMKLRDRDYYSRVNGLAYRINHELFTTEDLPQPLAGIPQVYVGLQAFYHYINSMHYPCDNMTNLETPLPDGEKLAEKLIEYLRGLRSQFRYDVRDLRKRFVTQLKEIEDINLLFEEILGEQETKMLYEKLNHYLDQSEDDLE